MGTDRKATVALSMAMAAVLGAALAIASACGSGGGAAQYEVTVRFNTEATRGDIEELRARLRTFDDDLDFFITETFPPIGRAVLTTDGPDFCRTIEAELESRSYVDSVSCRPMGRATRRSQQPQWTKTAAWTRPMRLRAPESA